MSTSFEPGAPVPEGFIPLCVPEIKGNEWSYIKECLDTKFVSSVGSFVDRFEEMLASFVGTKHAVATVNGTAALHIALILAGVRPGDEVLVSTLTFIAPVNAIRYVGAKPVFIDAEPEYWEMDVSKVMEFLERECHRSGGDLIDNRTGAKVRAILPVHILGHPVDMDPLIEAAHKYGLKVIEDASESLGAKYKGRMVGSLGDIGCFSFNGNKLITTGGGGVIVTDDEALAGRAKYLTTQAKDDPLEYIHGEEGYNYRLTNIQAALGCAQMERIDGYIDIKRRNAAAYEKALLDVPGIRPMSEADWAFGVFWMYTVLVDEPAYGMSSRQLLHRLADVRIQTRPLWQPIHMSPAYSDCRSPHCEVAERLCRDGLSLPCSVGLSGPDLARVASKLSSFARGRA